MLKIEYDPAPSEADRELVLKGLREFNRQRAPDPNFQRLDLFARDEQGRVRGGLLARTGWEWLYVEILWLDEQSRGAGAGSRLLTAAEDEARCRGCRGAFLDTFDFQALPFYQRHGYTIFGTQEDYPPGSRNHFLQKKLIP